MMPLADPDQHVDADHRAGDGTDRHRVVAADRVLDGERDGRQHRRRERGDARGRRDRAAERPSRRRTSRNTP
jgi:hypothetical protein